jgi:DNA-binding NarL/FixJ family response regulator
MTGIDASTPRRDVLIVHSQTLFRDGLRSLIESRGDLRVVAEAADGWEAVNLARRLRPSVIVTEVSLAGLNAVDATRHIITETPNVKIIGLSRNGDERLAAQMIRAGAHGYLVKDYGRDDLMKAIDTALGGQVYLQSSQKPLPSLEPGDRGPALTPREREVLQLISEGNSTRQIAEKLIVSTKTVETHRKHIMDKLDTHSIAELTKYAIREGMTSIEH